MRYEIEYITDWDTRDMEDLDLWYGGEGFYFTDETGNFDGPFHTMEEAKEKREQRNAW